MAHFEKSFEKQIHFTPAELDALEKRSRELSRMDWTDKVKLIQGNRKALDQASAITEMVEAYGEMEKHHEDPIMAHYIGLRLHNAMEDLRVLVIPGYEPKYEPSLDDGTDDSRTDTETGK